MLSFPPTIPLQKIEYPVTEKAGVLFYVLRLDTVHPYAGGNKLFKLKYNLEEAERKGYKRILTFGGAWSNHLAAVAEACSLERGPEVVAVVRGEEPEIYSDTLNFCRERGVILHFVSREEYRRKNEPGFIGKLRERYGDFYLLPEGGSNALAVKGCREIIKYPDIDFDLICCPVGSGATLAGIASGLKKEQRALGFSVLKGAEYLEEQTRGLVPETLRFELVHDYHFGGFAKTTGELLSFRKDFEEHAGFKLDPVYTAKMFFGILDLVKKGFFKHGSVVVALHTGGLQGNRSA